MSIVNRRNALLGWAVWETAKFYAKSKARQAVPGRGDYAGLNKGAIASLLLVIVGALWLRRVVSGDESVV